MKQTRKAKLWIEDSGTKKYIIEITTLRMKE